MAGVTNVIGLAADAAGLFTFADQYFAGPEVSKATIRITAGLEGWKGPNNGDPLEDPQGGIGNVKIFNALHQMIGSSGGGYVESGQHLDISVSQVNDQQGFYVQVFGTDDLICIPQITVTWASGEKYGWMGDFANVCGLDWYYSGRTVDGTSHEPMCAWLAFKDPDAATPDTIEINMPKFYASNADAVNKDLSAYCNNDALRAWKDGNDIAYYSGVQSRKSRRSTHPNVQDERLVVSSMAGHNATKLCTSPTSRGPDFVSLSEGLFCDMDTRQILPLCEDDDDIECFHLEQTKKVKRDEGPSAPYAKVVEWGP